MNLSINPESYTHNIRDWLDRSDHYLRNASPGAFFAVTVRPVREGLFEGGVPDETKLLGVCVLGRPVARELPQDGTMAEITRMYLVPGLPKGTASAVLRVALEVARERCVIHEVIAYHDRTRHTGCIYKKAGFKRWPGGRKIGGGWGSREGRVSAEQAPTKKRRWIFVVRERAA